MNRGKPADRLGGKAILAPIVVSFWQWLERYFRIINKKGGGR